MKTIKILNTIAISLPFAILITYPIFKESALFYSLLSTIMTGFIQLILGVKMLLANLSDKHFQIYIIGVIVFFGLILINYFFVHNFILYFILSAIPPMLAIYLSVLIYNKPNK